MLFRSIGYGRYQQTRALLVTAVADRAAAVDVSGLWQSIAHRVEPVPASVTPLAAARQARWLHAARSAVRRITPLQAGTLAAMAAAAVLAFGIGTGGDTTSTAEVARGGLLQSRPVRIDSMEVAAGHTVSTWVKPRTKTRVIWVANNAGFAVSNASHNR